MLGRKKGWTAWPVLLQSQIVGGRQEDFLVARVRRGHNPNKGKQLKAAASHQKVKGKSRSTARKSTAKKSIAAPKSRLKAKPTRDQDPRHSCPSLDARAIDAREHRRRRARAAGADPVAAADAARRAGPRPAGGAGPLDAARARPAEALVDLGPAPSPVAVPEFTEAGVLLAITYSIREGRRGEFFDLMRELKPLLHTIGGGDVAIYEDRSRPNYLMEVFRFKDEVEFTAFDDKFHKDRKIAAIYALLDDIVEAEKSDFKIFERRL